MEGDKSAGDLGKPKTLALDDLDAKLDQLTAKVDTCILEIVQLRNSTSLTAARRSIMDAASSTSRGGRPSLARSSSAQSLGSAIRPSRLSQRSKASSIPTQSRQTLARDSLGQAQLPQLEGGRTARRTNYPIRNMDLRMAWQEYAKETLHQELSEVGTDGDVQQVMRMMHRNRCDYIWELLDDPQSSRYAWWLSQFFSMFVIGSMLLSLLEASEEEPLIDANTAAWMWLCLDSFFLLEFLCRILSAPSKWSYVVDWLNWADMISALGLPLRATAGFFLPASLSTQNSELVILLFLILPIIRFLKLLRYFESFRLLIDAARSSAEALPVLCYIMAIITLLSATAMYLFEERSNIPTIYHSMWLAIVTMTTVGYGDYYPTSLAGYIIASILTFTSVLFLSLPVGIIGHEFTRSWQIRGQVLLKNRIRRCMLKWGYSSKDLRLLIEYVDVNCDGMLALTEFLELMRQMRIGISAQSAIDLFMAFDDDANGYIDYDEFLRQIFPEEYVKETVDSQILYSYGEKIPQAPVSPPETILESPEIILQPAESRLRPAYGAEVDENDVLKELF